MIAIVTFLLLVSGYLLAIRGRGWVTDAGIAMLLGGVVLMVFQ